VRSKRSSHKIVIKYQNIGNLISFLPVDRASFSAPYFHTMTPSIRLFAFSMLSSFTVALNAQTKVATPTPTDLDWQNIRSAAFAPPAKELLNAPDEASLKIAIANQASRFHQSADLAKDFYTKNPQHKKATEARKLEAIMLVQAVQSGDTAIEGRMETTVNAFINDKTVGEAYRAEIAGTHAFAGLAGKALSADEMSNAQEKIARSLMLSFPSQPQGYESLLTLAQQKDMVKEKALLQELLATPAPVSVKQSVQLLLERLALVGQPFSDVLSDAGAKTVQSAVVAGKPTLVYTWASWSPGSIDMAEKLAKRNTAAANLVGVNLDSDQTVAMDLATKHGLPGAQQFDSRGADGALAKRLKVNGAPLVFLIDAKGVIQDVRGTDNFDQKLTALGL
jgi:hypothetical protein